MDSVFTDTYIEVLYHMKEGHLEKPVTFLCDVISSLALSKALACIMTLVVAVQVINQGSVDAALF